MPKTLKDYRELLETGEQVLTISREDLEGLIGRRRSKKAHRDPTKPKRPKSSFLHFKDSTNVREQFAESKPEFWNEEKGCPKKVTELTKFARDLWSNLTVEEKSPFVEMALKEKEAYIEQMKSYNPIQISDGVDECVELPIGWSGPFEGHYLAGNADGRKTYSSLTEAIKAAESVENCMGITRNSRGRYKLRKMDGGSPIQTLKGDTSWVRGECGFEEQESDETVPEVVQWRDYLVDEDSGEVYDRDKFMQDNEVVVIGRREPNLEDGELISN